VDQLKNHTAYFLAIEVRIAATRKDVAFTTLDNPNPILPAGVDYSLHTAQFNEFSTILAGPAGVQTGYIVHRLYLAHGLNFATGLPSGGESPGRHIERYKSLSRPHQTCLPAGRDFFIAAGALRRQYIHSFPARPRRV